MIDRKDRDEMLRVLGEAWAFRHDGKRYFADSYEDIRALIQSAPDPAKVKALVEAGNHLSELIEGMTVDLKECWVFVNFKSALSALTDRPDDGKAESNHVQGLPAPADKGVTTDLTQDWLTRQAEVVSRESGLPMADLFRFGRMVLTVAGVDWAKKFEEDEIE